MSASSEGVGEKRRSSALSAGNLGTDKESRVRPVNDDGDGKLPALGLPAFWEPRTLYISTTDPPV